MIVCGEGIVDEKGQELGAQQPSHRPGRERGPHRRLRGPAPAADRALRRRLLPELAPQRSRPRPRSSPVKSATPSAAAGPSSSTASTPPSSAARRWTCCWRARTTPSRSCSGTASKGFYVDSYDGNDFRDRWGLIHARHMHPTFYDPELHAARRASGIEYLLPIFTNAIGHADVEHVRQSTLRLGQPLPALPLRQHRHQQAHPVSRGRLTGGGAGRSRHPSLPPPGKRRANASVSIPAGPT